LGPEKDVRENLWAASGQMPERFIRCVAENMPPENMSEPIALEDGSVIIEAGK
jgi:hypothetical protein